MDITVRLDSRMDHTLMNISKYYYVYLLGNKSKMLYVGMTNNLERRLFEHKRKLNDSWATRYNLHKLLYFEVYLTPGEAITREKQIKKWSRRKKISLFRKSNPGWDDISENWVTI